MPEFKIGDVVRAKRSVVDHGCPAYVVGLTGVVQPSAMMMSSRVYNGHRLYLVRFSRAVGMSVWGCREADLEPVV